MTADLLRTRNNAILRDMTPYLVALPNHWKLLDRSPFGLTISQENTIDPTLTSSERFLLLLQTLDRLTFGPEGMPMPRWVFYDCAEIPGAVFGFAQRAENLPKSVREAIGLEAGETGLVPFSTYIAIPIRPPHVWFGHNLSSLNPTFPAMNLKGLASITKALGLKVFRCVTQIGATQWDSDALHIHTRFGPLQLVTAWTPAHSEAATLTYRLDVTDDKLRHAYGDMDAPIHYPDADFEIAADDWEAMRDLQARIEAGEQFAVVGSPRRHEKGRRIPVARI
ncbi:MAG: hypothetical protein MJE77_09300 [Proteobacteria bacterium]|nr:hypothetical protein [Pseudomonadota bacterium]